MANHLFLSIQIGAVALLMYAVAILIYRICFHPLRGVPGPFLGKITELWRTKRYFQGTWHKDILELHRQYGPLVRLSPNEVSLCDENALDLLYSTASQSLKTDWYDTWTPHGQVPSFFNVTNPKLHAFLRRRVAGVYSMSSILRMDSRIQSVADALWLRLDGFAGKSLAIDLTDWANYFAFDVVGVLALGEPLGFVKDGNDSKGLIASIHDYFFLSSTFGYLPGQTKIVFHPLVGRLLPGSSGGMTYFMKFLVQQINRRRQRGPPEQSEGDLLDHFLCMKDADGNLVKDSEVMTEAGNILGAGADTTAIGISTVLGQLLTHPESYQEVQREIDEAAVQIRHDNAEALDHIPFRVASQLPFLNACIKEALRLHPSILWQLPRKVPAQGITVKGFYIPSSCTASISPIAQNRCVEIFGSDADEWRPSRWIVGRGSSEEQLKKMLKLDATFGYGSRVCVGKHLATVEITKFVSQALYRYDIQLVREAGPWQTKSMWFSYHKNMMVKLQKREHLK